MGGGKDSEIDSSRILRVDADDPDDAASDHRLEIDRLPGRRAVGRAQQLRTDTRARIHGHVNGLRIAGRDLHADQRILTASLVEDPIERQTAVDGLEGSLSLDQRRDRQHVIGIARIGENIQAYRAGEQPTGRRPATGEVVRGDDPDHGRSEESIERRRPDLVQVCELQLVHLAHPLPCPTSVLGQDHPEIGGEADFVGPVGGKQDLQRVGKRAVGSGRAGGGDDQQRHDDGPAMPHYET
jgi:hypothetical protein